jgi:Raf kinase inhibitor-like YbhB/YbcL family protein
MTQAQNPYDSLPSVPSFTVTSYDVAAGETLAKPHLSGIFGAGGEDRSPHLAWEGFPAETKSFAVTCFDPDAPTGSGYWHWSAFDIPATILELPRGAGTPGKAAMPAGAVQVRNDGGTYGFEGAAPPAGDGEHRYVFTVYAVDREKLGPDREATPAQVGFMLRFHTIGRARLIGTYDVPAGDGG